jgi:hypothetical protein
MAGSAVKWDLTPGAPGGVPPGMRITGARLKLYVADRALGSRYVLYALRAPWTEAAGSWRNRAALTPWSGAGANGSSDRGTWVRGAFTSAPLSSGGVYSLVVDLAATGRDTLTLINQWYAGTAANHGFLLRPTANNPAVNAADALAVHSSENLYPPILELTYVPMP